MVWLNIDIPTRRCILHTDYGCPYWKKKKETQYKGLGNLKRDGGWMSFTDTREALFYYQGNFPGYELITHC
jgi:hypothetical protein